MNDCEYYQFFSKVSCLFVEEVEFMTKAEIYDSIKREWTLAVDKTREEAESCSKKK